MLKFPCENCLLKSTCTTRCENSYLSNEEITEFLFENLVCPYCGSEQFLTSSNLDFRCYDCTAGFGFDEDSIIIYSSKEIRPKANYVKTDFNTWMIDVIGIDNIMEEYVDEKLELEKTIRDKEEELENIQNKINIIKSLRRKK